jgi:hypothetical protein
MTRHVIIDKETKKVVNCIVWENSEWVPPRNHIVIKSDNASIGDEYNEVTKSFNKPLKLNS